MSSGALAECRACRRVPTPIWRRLLLQRVASTFGCQANYIYDFYVTNELTMLSLMGQFGFGSVFPSFSLVLVRECRLKMSA